MCESMQIGFIEYPFVSLQKAVTSEDSGKKKEFQKTAHFRAADF